VPAYGGGADNPRTGTYTFSNNFVSQYSDFSFPTNLAISAGETLIIQFPYYNVGFFSDYLNQNIKCKFGTNTNCLFFAIADWVVIENIDAGGITSGNVNEIK
jgi:hypothetical protein